MAGWTSQMGYPVLHIAADGSSKQTRFLALKHADASSQDAVSDAGKLWKVPVNGLLFPEKSAVAAAVVGDREAGWIGASACPTSFKLNVDQTGTLSKVFEGRGLC